MGEYMSNKDTFVIFRFECSELLVKYRCSKDYVSKADIEDCAVSYYDSDAYDEDSSYEDIVHDIMTSFDGVEYEIIDCACIDMEYCYSQN